jgi:cation diffusion facilitator family transporter
MNSVPTASRFTPGAREQRHARGIRAVAIGIVVNALLIVLKATAGILGHSTGLVADAVHSGADLANSTLALASLLVSRRPADVTHPFGHGRAEALAANFAGVIIAGAGLLVGWESVSTLIQGTHSRPDWLTLWVGLAAVMLKLAMTIYAGRVASAINSKAVHADARDHLADVLSGSVVVLGILLARVAGWTLFDPIAGLIVSGFILWTAVEVWMGAANELMDTSLSPLVRAEVISEVGQVNGIRMTGVAGRTIGDMTLVEIHADVDPNLTVGEAGRIVDAVKARLVGRVADVSHVVVELNSCNDEPSSLRIDADCNTQSFAPP